MDTPSSPPSPPLWLVDAYYATQIVLVIAAIAGAYFAYRQFKAFCTFELIKYIQDDKLREARGKIWFNKKPYEDWTADDKFSASHVAASYDTMGNLLRSGFAKKSIFMKAYASSIQATAKRIRLYRDADVAKNTKNDPGYFEGFDWLIREAEKTRKLQPDEL